MEGEKKQNFFSVYRCLILFVAIIAVSAVIAVISSGSGSGQTYTASSDGLFSEVSVTVTIDDGEITDVVIDASGETPEIGGAAAEELAQTILNIQGSGFDAVSGATVTSTAVRTALNDCLAQAGFDHGAAGTDSGSGLAAGTYSAQAMGLESVVTVTIVIDEEGVITDVDIDASNETPTIGGMAAERLADSILEVQSAEVDAVSGATVTSKAIVTALEDCLAQAEASQEESPDAGSEEIVKSEAVAESDEAEDSAKPDEEGESEDTVAEGASSGGFAAGIYSAEANGLESVVTVTITIDEAGVITDVDIDASGETPAIGGMAAEILADSILEAQSADVNSVSGATVTSKAVITALEDCLDQAK